MFQIDNSTATASQPASTAPGTPGFFTDGNPAGGAPATLVPAEWLNLVMMELINAVKAGGQVPSKSVFNQLALGMLALGSPYVADASSTVNQIVASFPTGYVRNEGQMVRIKVAQANTGPVTINDGIGTVPLVGGAHAALQGGELVASGDMFAFWNSSIGAAPGSYVLAEGLGGAAQVANGTKPQHAVTLNQLQSRAGTAGGLTMRNLLINAAGNINQRGYTSGTATTVANQYAIDRWKVVTAGQNLSWVASGVYSIFTAPAGGVSQIVESLNVLGGTYVLSWQGTATATVNGTAVANGGTIALAANTNATVTFSGGTFYLPQLELGAAATAFEFRGYAAELALCQRYFETGGLSLSVSTGTSNGIGGIFKVTKRAVPAMVRTGQFISANEAGTVFSGVTVSQYGMTNTSTAAGGLWTADCDI
jgi:hypothetical protein